MINGGGEKKNKDFGLFHEIWDNFPSFWSLRVKCTHLWRGKFNLSESFLVSELKQRVFLLERIPGPKKVEKH